MRKNILVKCIIGALLIAAYILALFTNLENIIWGRTELYNVAVTLVYLVAWALFIFIPKYNKKAAYIFSLVYWSISFFTGFILMFDFSYNMGIRSIMIILVLLLATPMLGTNFVEPIYNIIEIEDSFFYSAESINMLFLGFSTIFLVICIFRISRKIC